MISKTCVICGKQITNQFWCCSKCEEQYSFAGIPYKDWPEWIKVLVRTSRRQTTIDRREYAFSSLGFDPFEYISESTKYSRK